jgi:hypothetical protein
MGKILHKLVTLLLQKLIGRFVVIMVILLGIAWFKYEWAALQVHKSDEKKIEKLLGDAKQGYRRAQDDLEKRESEWKRERDAFLQPIRNQIESIDRELTEKGPLISKVVEQLRTEEGQAELLQGAVDAAKVARDNAAAQMNWHDDKWLLGWWRNSVTRSTKLLSLESTLAVAKQAAESNTQLRTQLNRQISQLNVGTLSQRRKELETKLAAEASAARPEEQELRNEVKRREEAVHAFDEALQGKRAAITNDPRQRTINAVRDWTPTALWILAGMTITPPILKGICYYFLAPFACRMKPICVLPTTDAPPLPAPPQSSVSMDFEIGQNEELLVHPDFLQSSSRNARKCTQALLNPRIPFSSIASGMWLLTRLRPAGSETTRVVVSSQRDAFGEIGCIELPEGATMVVHPRSLAGVTKRVGVPLRITRHWRLFSLHAWLTFQLRYLVFHGPCKLILKGCRGIRAEKPDEGQPRMINQALTIGFSANLEYKNTRCETFIPYLLGKEDLFNDLFTGERGMFVYEETPDGGRKGGITGRWLEGMLDVILKGFGL